MAPLRKTFDISQTEYANDKFTDNLWSAVDDFGVMGDLDNKLKWLRKTDLGQDL
jgi:hypothetical protein